MMRYFGVRGIRPLNRWQQAWVALRGDLRPVDASVFSARVEEPTIDRTDGVWLNIASRGGWDQAGAIRGPDGPFPWDRLKHAFTERIRYLLLRDGGAAHSYPTRRRRLITKEARLFIDTMRALGADSDNTTALQHFLSHVRFAAEAFGDEKLAELADMFVPRESNHYKPDVTALTVERVIELAGGKRETA